MTSATVTRRPANAHMKIGMYSGVFFLLVAQVILLFVLPQNPENSKMWLEIGMTSNLLVFSSVIVLVIGVAERKFKHCR